MFPRRYRLAYQLLNQTTEAAPPSGATSASPSAAALAAADALNSVEIHEYNALIVKTLDRIDGYNRRVHECTCSIVAFPMNAAAYYARATIHQQYGNLQFCISDLNEAILRAPYFAAAHYLRATVEVQLYNSPQTTPQQRQKLLDDCHLLVKLMPTWGKSYFTRGLAYYNLHSYSNAVADFRRDINLHPNSLIAYKWLCRACLSAKKYEEAVAAGEHLLALNPTSSDARRVRSIALCELHRYDEALADLDTIIKNKPDNARAYYYRCIARMATGDYKGSREDYLQHKALAPTMVRPLSKALAPLRPPRRRT